MLLEDPGEHVAGAERKACREQAMREVDQHSQGELVTRIEVEVKASGDIVDQRPSASFGPSAGCAAQQPHR